MEQKEAIRKMLNHLDLEINVSNGSDIGKRGYRFSSFQPVFSVPLSSRIYKWGSKEQYL